MTEKFDGFDFNGAAEYLRASTAKQDACIKKFETFLEALRNLCREHEVSLRAESVDEYCENTPVIQVREYAPEPQWWSSWADPLGCDFRNELKE